MKKYLATAANVILYFVVFYFTMFVFGRLLAIEAYGKLIEANPPLHLVFIFGVTMLLYWLLFKLNLVVSNTERQSFVQVVKFVKLPSRLVVFSFLIGLAGALASLGLLEIVSLKEVFPDLEANVDSMMGSGNFLLIIAALGILFPALEEVIFRGLLFNELKKVMPLWIAVVLQMIGYVAVQPSAGFMLISVVTGTVYCLIYIIARSLWAPIIVQITAMSLFFIGYKLDVGKGWMNSDPAAIAITLVGVVGMIALTIWLNRRNRDARPATTF
ncbi:CPBP family intramembrane metalloprotease [Cohnella sp. LGH]|uniref:CPBP family intramembrane glutamic endopeptidase n=1 Tax=Cohnella sp. LGH TaxID=1619153 RepID=UPI001ADC6411|nr:CPBP family intramembrane glutamic endopeptidase [Cohnella sp. LGH]QTH45762.1 CPBP family intramembrane metalloprotease [Cohnella sp. LGH]